MTSWLTKLTNRMLERLLRLPPGKILDPETIEIRDELTRRAGGRK